jgi:hypothetical protein
MSTIFEEGDSVRFSEAGRAKVRGMPEAWGLHRALYGEETGEVVEFAPADGEQPGLVSVEFPSGGAYNWDADCFEPAAPESQEGSATPPDSAGEAPRPPRS